MNHPKTIIISTWFDKTKYLSVIPQPSYVLVDEPNIFSKNLPNIFIQVEPNIMTNDEMYLIQNHSKYNIIITYNKNVLNNCPNAKFYVYGTTWIPRDYYVNIDISKKEFKISTFAGSKLLHDAPGHKLRQILHNNQHLFLEFPITFFRSYVQQPHLIDYGDNPFIKDSKIELFETFQFSIIIENSQQINYFTEKLVDCLITKTIPIYWGCPNISDFFNTDGWIILDSDSIDKITYKLNKLTPDHYYKYLDNIEQNYLKAIEYSDLYVNINNAK